MRPTVALLLACLVPAAFAASGPRFTTAEISRQIELDHACIRQADAQIATQREIGEASGFVDRRALYVAGANKVQCRRHIEALLTCSQVDECQGLTPLSAPVGTHAVPGRPNTFALDPSAAP